MTETELDIIDRVLRQYNAYPGLAPIILYELANRKIKVLMDTAIKLGDHSIVKAHVQCH